MLRVPRDEFDRELEQRWELGRELLERGVSNAEAVEALQSDFRTWNAVNERLLKQRFTTDEVAKQYAPVAFFSSGGASSTPLARRLELMRKDIEHGQQQLASIRQQLEYFDSAVESTGGATHRVPTSSEDKTIFVVHGHDDARKLEVARFLENTTGKTAVILHEEPHKGRTIIEKLEDHGSDAGFAVILLTGDDEGAEIGGTVRPRARQNVILELGFFLGALGRSRVVALYDEGVELPSDINGVLYVSLAGQWKADLAKELGAAGISTDMGRA
jgi:predicted nucleotide-binding protein